MLPQQHETVHIRLSWCYFQKKAYFSFIFQIRSDILELAGGALAGAYGCKPGKIAGLCGVLDAEKKPRRFLFIDLVLS